MLAKKTSKNQITIPKAIVSEFDGVDYFDVRVENGQIVLAPVKSTQYEIEAVWDKLEKLGISESDVEDAIRWARQDK